MSWAGVWAIVVNEQRRLLAHKEIALFVLALPLIIITLIGLTFGTTGAIDLGVLDEDGSARSRSLVERFRDVDGVDLRIYTDEGALREDVRATAIQAGLLIPAGYARDLAAGRAELDVVADPTSEGVASALATLDGAVTAEGVREGAIAAVQARTGGSSRRDAADLVDAQAERLEPLGVRATDVGDAQVAVDAFSHTTPANLVLFVFINTFALSTVLAFDRKGGIIARMLATPTSSATVVVGLGLSKLVFALAQSALLVGVGALVFGVEWGDPVGAALVVVLFAAISTGVGLLIGAWTTDAEQAQAIGIPLAVGMGMLGGCMWPLDIVPRPMQLVGHLTPHAWAMDSWVELIFEGASPAEILPNLAVLAAIALAVGLLAVRTLRRAVTG